MLDAIFRNFYQIFSSIFDGCGIEFQREIFISAEFKYYGQMCNQDDDDEWLRDNELPIIELSGKKAKRVHFILEGKAYIMNKEGLYEYGMLEKGSYFGDISILLDKSSEYSYFYNPYNEKPLLLLSIHADDFIRICNEYPLAKDILTQRAI